MKFNVIFLENYLRMSKKSCTFVSQLKNKFNKSKYQDYDTSRTTNTYCRNQKQNR